MIGGDERAGKEEAVRDRSVAAALQRVVADLEGGGERREGQLAMAEAVASAIDRRRHLVVRAGTGTGKSLAYLLPAILSGQRVVIATATRNLQDQLAAKDLPSISDRLDRTFTYAVLKGRSNYLCRQRLSESKSSGDQATFDDDAGAAPTATQVAAVIEWSEQTESGDVAELGFEPDGRVWRAFSVGPDECPGAHRCPSGSSCFAEAAKQKAAEADVIVVNLHLLGAHIASGDAVLPDHDVLVVDEAHELEEVMSHTLGASVSPGRMRAVVSAARTAGHAQSGGAVDVAATRVTESATRFEELMTARTGERLRGGNDPDLDDLVALTASRLETLESELRASGAGAASDSDTTSAVDRAVQQAGRLREDVVRIGAPGDGEVVWVESGARPSIEIAPIDVGSILGPRVFGVRPVVLTSATIPPGLASRLGVDATDVDELDVGSPFAFEERALLYCAAHLPDRKKPESEAAIHAELRTLIAAAGGRTLGLFTSWRAMRAAADAVRAELGDNLLVQGEGSRAELVRRFRSEPETCLFATMGFWQGIDVPGQTLSLVTIDRLPFSRPDEPLLVARRERAGSEAFMTVDLPRAASLLAQGAGRLIRTAEDRGVVAVFDPRLANASYRWQLIRALPPMRRTKDRSVAEEFLAQIRDEATVRAPSR
jgi:ATP-dependent DNA helicase DinG